MDSSVQENLDQIQEIEETKSPSPLAAKIKPDEERQWHHSKNESSQPAGFKQDDFGGILYTDNDENSIKPVSLQHKNFKSPMLSPQKRSREVSIINSITEREIQTQDDFFDMFKDDMTPISFGGPEFNNIANECLENHVREYLANSGRLYRYTLIKASLGDHEGSEDEEADPNSKSPEKQNKWQQHAKVQRFIDKLKISAEELSTTIKTEYISKYLARNIKL